jgi:hypothetical protein
MKRWIFGLVAAVLGGALLAGCGSSADATPAQSSSAAGYTSQTLVTSYPGALDVSSQLALGTLELEGTEDAVTPEQAATLLPLWQALQSGVTAQAEVNAVLAQIERTMSPEQLAAIAAMQLTQDDLAAWAQEHGVSMPAPGGSPGGQGTPREDWEAIRATVEAGGAPPFPVGTPPASFGGQGMSDEQRAAIRATVEAGGGMPGGGRPAGMGRGVVNGLIAPLVELLSQRAGE